ncbi:Ribosomal protein S16 family protein [Hibiscus syriacus]|uniref:Ribosomal protein S16 family protein n=1 Tax=Hibiscus syriacus TaxID=106335 RepID=A0A6A2YSX3_HIBSY|nr:zinc finger CCCH domain-containing protein 65 [Hibiscus syriacus]KAE8682581.1 Ribosomal protein S16 family protein [Hibiscus syriacus]
MEEPQEPGVGAPFSFPPHRRSHLRSGTYRNLVRLISICYGDSPLATAPPIIPLPQTPDNGCNRHEPCGDDVREPGELIVSHSKEPANMAAQEGNVVNGGSEEAVFQDKEFKDTQMVIDEIEQIMGMEEGQDLLSQNGMMVDSSMEGNGVRDGEIGRELMLMADLENIMKSNEDCDKISNCLTAALGRNQGDSCTGILLNSQEKSNDCPPFVMEETGAVAKPQVDMKDGNQKIIDAFGFSLDKGSTAEVLNSNEKVNDQSCLLETNLMHEKIEIQQKEMDLENFVCSNEGVCSPGQMVEDGELEEGEIFGDIQLLNESFDMLLDDAVVSEKIVEEKQVSKGIFEDKHLHCNEENTSTDRTYEFTSFNRNISPVANKVTPRELEGSETNRLVNELGMMQTKEGSGKIQKQVGSKNQVSKSKTKIDVGLNKKKKQCLTPAEKNEKKKRNKRKKRAEKNRQLGVKRLKLQTVLKPKPVSYCRHYLKGRCHEGEKCKFSHDTVPLTKSQPCSHFARNSCMKGDDCPFDHLLFKYPCINYMTKGSCSRGDDCLFSHKMPVEGDVASFSTAPELHLKPSSQSDSDMRLSVSRASHKDADASSYSVRSFPDKSKRKFVADTPSRTPDIACKGESIKVNQGSSSQKMNESGGVGYQSNQRMLGVNCPFASRPSAAESSKFSLGSSFMKISESGRLGIQANRSESHTIQNVDAASPKKKPEVVPRGINFLSFGKSSLEDSTSNVSLLLNRAYGYKQLPSDNEGHSGKFSNQTTQSKSSTDQKKTHPAELPLGINLTVGRPVYSGNYTPASLPCCSDNINNGSLAMINYVDDKQNNSSAMSYKLPVSSQTSGQSSECLALKSTPNSAREALVSTLAMVKKIDIVEGKSVHESRPLSDKQYNSTANPWKMPASLLTAGQSPENITPKATPNSSQKALMSTLAFAKMFESGMKKNHSAIRASVHSETGDNKTGEGSKTGTAKTSMLLDILSSSSNKIKQQ